MSFLMILHRVSNSLNSSVGVDMSACARAACALPAAAAPRSCSTVARLTDAVVAHAQASPMHRARNSVVSGGLLPVQKTTSYNLDVGRQGPTSGRRVKGGDSSLVSCRKGGGRGKFSAGGPVTRACCGAILQMATRTRNQVFQGSAVTPSLHPEAPHSQFVSPGRGLGIRHSMGWEKVCGTAGSGIWVLKGDRRCRMLPANLYHRIVQWRKRGSHDTAWVTPGHDCLCSHSCGQGAAVRPQTNNSIWDGVIGLWSRVAREVNLNRYAS